MTSIDVVYLAGGEGIRAGLGYPKQFYRLGGKPIIVHGLETLRKIDMIGDILIPCVDEGYIYKICKDFNIQGIRPVHAGSTRQTSVYNGITETLTPFVIIMEAVRPFITEELIRKVIETEGEAVTPIKRNISTPLSIVEVGEEIYVHPLSRGSVGEVQMPQKFNNKLLLRAHRRALYNNRIDYSDDVALLHSEFGKYSKCIDGIEENIKVTSPLDLVVAEAIYKSLHGLKVESE
jgi:2-C-methyl-D-erythritol 4-phosphate cytidylyltransferase